jgi:hypothetical protein
VVGMKKIIEKKKKTEEERGERGFYRPLGGLDVGLAVGS